MKERKISDSFGYILSLAMICGIYLVTLEIINPGRVFSTCYMIIAIVAVYIFFFYLKEEKTIENIIIFSASPIYFTAFTMLCIIDRKYIVIGVFSLSIICIFIMRLNGAINIKQIVKMAYVIAFVAFIGISKVLSSNSVEDVLLLNSNVSTNKYFFIEKYKDELVEILDESTFNSMNEDERLQALGVIAEIESQFLGIERPAIEIDNISSGGILGYYDGKNQRIVMDASLVNDGSPERNVKVLLHELYHAYERGLAMALDSGWYHICNSQLYIFRKAQEYQKEFRNYKDSRVYGHEMYAGQALEMDANAYAVIEWNNYSQFILELN